MTTTSIRNVIFVGFVSFVFTSLALAQEKREKLDASGTLKAIAPGAIQFAAKDGEIWTVKLPAKPQDLTFSGSAEHSFLKPGMMVRFTATMNKKGQVVGTIPSITIFTPIDATDVGLHLDKPQSGGNPLGGLFNDNKPMDEPKKPVKKPVVEQVDYRIGGKLVSLRNNRLVVSAGGTSVKCELAENAKISVSIADLSWAKPGDKVEVDAWYYANMKQAGAMGEKVTILASEPLKDEKKKPATDDDKKSEK